MTKKNVDDLNRDNSRSKADSKNSKDISLGKISQGKKSNEKSHEKSKILK